MQFVYEVTSFRRLGCGASSICGHEKPNVGDFSFIGSFDDIKDRNHTEPNLSCCISCKTSISYESYVKVDMKHSVNSHFNTDSSFIQDLDLKSFKTLAKLKLQMENFTVKELRDLYRKSRVVIHANFTNNRHVHEEIMREIERCKVVVKDTERRREHLECSRASSVAKYREVLKEFHEAHERLVEVTQMKIEAEELHSCLMEKVRKTKITHDQVVAQHSRQVKPCVGRERKNSV